MADAKPKRLGDLLVDKGFITMEQLGEALAQQKKQGVKLGKVLVQSGYITETDLINVLNEQLGNDGDFSMIGNVDPRIIQLLPLHVMKKYKAIPLEEKNGKLVVAMADPRNMLAVDDLRLATGMDVMPVLFSEYELDRAITGVKEGNEPVVFAQQAASREGTEDGPIINIVNSLFEQAIKEKASDIHIEPQEDGMIVRCRIDGVLRDVARFPMSMHPALVSRVKIMAELDIAEKRVPQDGRFHINDHLQSLDFRVSTVPTILGEKIVLRVLDKKASLSRLSVDTLGLTDRQFQQYERIYKQPHGLILVTGPTGSGKTTTLYATLSTLKTQEKNLVTIEDPVEYRLHGINQIQVNLKAGMTFAGGLRSIMRQDPDIIMVGEIRDGETADVAVRAALTGHLVLSTLHTNTAAGAINRLVDMGVEPFLVSSSLVGVVAQRLVRTICPRCAYEYEVRQGSDEYEALGLQPGDSLILRKGKGCTHCGETGYRGRTPVFEFLTVTEEIREMISERPATRVIEKLALQAGMETLYDDCVRKVKAGRTTVDELRRVIGFPGAGTI